MTIGGIYCAQMMWLSQWCIAVDLSTKSWRCWMIHGLCRWSSTFQFSHRFIQHWFIWHLFIQPRPLTKYTSTYLSHAHTHSIPNQLFKFVWYIILYYYQYLLLILLLFIILSLLLFITNFFIIYYYYLFLFFCIIIFFLFFF